jgi:hypothetical protein
MGEALVPVPREDDDAWGRFVVVGLRGSVLPGRVKVVPKGSIALDEKNAGGTNDATLSINGRKLHDFDITCTWEETIDDRVLDLELARCEAFIDLMFPDGNKVSDPHDCAHPILAMWKCRSMVFYDLEGPTCASQVWTLKVKAKKFAPPPKKAVSVTKTPGKSIGGAGGNVLDGKNVPYGPPPPPGWKPPTSPDKGTPKP